MIKIHVTQQVLAPVKQVNQTLLDHAKLERFFNAKISLIKNELDGELLGGEGAIRQIAIGKIVFKEQIISATNEHICYRIMSNWPVSEHQGDIRLAPIGNDNQSTLLDYVIQFKGLKWLPDLLLKFFVGRDIENAMKKLAEHFNAEHACVKRSNENTSKGKSV
jgi:hypothetical protein